MYRIRWQYFFDNRRILELFFWLSDWLTNYLPNWSIELLLPMTLTRSINNAVGFTSLKSWIVFTKIHFYPKLLEYLNFHAVHSKELAKVYTVILISIFIDTYLGATLLSFSWNSRQFAQFWKLNFQKPDKFKKAFKNELTEL